MTPRLARCSTVLVAVAFAGACDRASEVEAGTSHLEAQFAAPTLTAQDSALRILYYGSVEGRIMSANGRPGFRKNRDHQTCC